MGANNFGFRHVSVVFDEFDYVEKWFRTAPKEYGLIDSSEERYFVAKWDAEIDEEVYTPAPYSVAAEHAGLDMEDVLGNILYGLKDEGFTVSPRCWDKLITYSQLLEISHRGKPVEFNVSLTVSALAGYHDGYALMLSIGVELYGWDKELTARQARELVPRIKKRVLNIQKERVSAILDALIFYSAPGAYTLRRYHGMTHTQIAELNDEFDVSKQWASWEIDDEFDLAAAIQAELDKITIS